MTTEPSPTGELRLSLELLWGRRERPTRGPKPGLSLDRIVDAAIAAADADGVEALSMRRVARELGVGTMSLYRYVPGKAELLNLMLDKVCDPGERVPPPGGWHWRGVLEATARSTYQLYLAHRWLLQVNWARPVLGPNSLAGVEFVISALAGVGLTDQERVMLLSAVDCYCVGQARSYVLYKSAAGETGISDEEFWAAQFPSLEQAMASGRFPAMAGLAEDAFGAGWDDTFEFGLYRLLDGIEVLVESRASS